VNLLVHALEGRLTLRIGLIKDKPYAASALGRSLAALKGVRQVKVTPITGGVVIFYDHWRVSETHLLSLFGITPLAKPPRTGPRCNSVLRHPAVAATMMRVLLVAAVYFVTRRVLPSESAC
jgi:hypothetical protein